MGLQNILLPKFCLTRATVSPVGLLPSPSPSLVSSFTVTTSPYLVGKGVDYWTLGILIYEMLVGDPPFLDEDPMGIYQQVLTGKVRFTRSYDKNAKSLTKKLLTSDLTKRYGCLKNGASDIKMSKWFLDMDWEALLSRKLNPPIVPQLASTTDTSNFDSYPEDEEPLIPPDYIDGPDPFEDFCVLIANQ